MELPTLNSITSSATATFRDQIRADLRKTITDLGIAHSYNDVLSHFLGQEEVLASARRDLHGEVFRWVLFSDWPSEWVRCVLSNDLRGATHHFPINDSPFDLFRLVEVCRRLPSACQGTDERMRQWSSAGGLVGLDLNASGEMGK